MCFPQTQFSFPPRRQSQTPSIISCLPAPLIQLWSASNSSCPEISLVKIPLFFSDSLSLSLIQKCRPKCGGKEEIGRNFLSFSSCPTVKISSCVLPKKSVWREIEGGEARMRKNRSSINSCREPLTQESPVRLYISKRDRKLSRRGFNSSFRGEGKERTRFHFCHISESARKRTHIIHTTHILASCQSADAFSSPA